MEIALTEWLSYFYLETETLKLSDEQHYRPDITKRISQVSLCANQNSSRGLPEYKYDALLLHQPDF
jgi:hypothetical protein